MPDSNSKKSDGRHGELVRDLAWPIVALVSLLLLRDPLAALLGRAQSVEVGKDGVKITAVVAAALGAAAATQGMEASPRPRTEPVDPQQIANSVEATLKGANAARLSEARVLWVDDNPDNNVYERQALEALGLHFVVSKSTDDALSKLKSDSFDVVITDMRRGEDALAGLRIVDASRAIGGKTIPVVIYSGSATESFEAEARSRGAYAATSDPQRLFEYVVAAIGTHRVDARAT